MESLSEDQFLAIAKHGKVITINEGGISVIQTASGNYIKIFRPNKLFSSDLISSRPQRFIRAANHLKRLGIPTVRNPELYRVPSMNKHVVHYQPLVGTVLQESLQTKYNPEIIEKFAQFLQQLHENGVYFRGVNFNNTVITEDNRIGLIDIGSVVVKNKGLSCGLRARNMKHPFRSKTDQELLERFGIAQFIECYASHGDVDKDAFYKKLSTQHIAFKSLSVN